MPLFQPFEKSGSDGNHARKSMVLREDGLADANQYVRGDLCTVTTSGYLRKFVDTTAANALRLCVADQDYIGDTSGLLEKNPAGDVYQKITHLDGKWVMVADGVSATPPTGRRNVSYDATDKVPKVQAGSTSVAVSVLGFDGMSEAGDDDAAVIVEWAEAVKY